MVSFAYPKPGQICNKVGTVMQSIADFPVKKGLYAIGHVRYSTSGGFVNNPSFCSSFQKKATGLFRFRSSLLAESRLISFPPAT